ncbi:MAG: MBL fold metallo-hydrolase, partial [Acidimicrobiia bacterium]
MVEVPALTLHELADGVFVWLQPGGESGVSNAGAVVDDDGVTVVDTLMVASQWQPFADAVNGLGLPVRRILLTHAHIDHVGGTRAFPNAGVYGSPQTSQLLDGAMPLAAYKAFMPAFEAEFDVLAELGTRPVTHLVTDGAFLTPRIEVMPASGHT